MEKSHRTWIIVLVALLVLSMFMPLVEVTTKLSSGGVDDDTSSSPSDEETSE